MGRVIVGGNTRRKLNPEESRELALSEKLAQLIFLNGADINSGQSLHLLKRPHISGLEKHGFPALLLNSFQQIKLKSGAIKLGLKYFYQPAFLT